MEQMESYQGLELEPMVLEFEKCAKTETTGFKHSSKNQAQTYNQRP
jgi:hypothetical protein